MFKIKKYIYIYIYIPYFQDMGKLEKSNFQYFQDMRKLKNSDFQYL